MWVARLRREGYSIAAMRALARRRLPRVMTGIGARDLSVELVGRRLDLPVILGPTGLSGLLWPGAERAAAAAADAAGTAYCLSHASMCSLESLPPASRGARWMQVFIYTDRGFTRDLVARAAATGYDALVLTVDNQLPGNREREIANGFTIPPRFGLAGTFEAAAKCSWLWRMRTELPQITFGNYLRPGERGGLRTVAERMAALLDPDVGWKDFEELRRAWNGPLALTCLRDSAECPRRPRSSRPGNRTSPDTGARKVI